MAGTNYEGLLGHPLCHSNTGSSFVFHGVPPISPLLAGRTGSRYTYFDPEDTVSWQLTISRNLL
jgi:hypothetical protein